MELLKDRWWGANPDDADGLRTLKEQAHAWGTLMQELQMLSREGLRAEKEVKEYNKQHDTEQA